MASLALTTSGLPPPTGVSVGISTEFVRPGGREGDELVIEGEVVKLGACRRGVCRGRRYRCRCRVAK